jgi:Mn-dependent DtxR family transcriptional regulator
MLGVRRATVSVIAHSLKEKGLVSYRRGKLTVTDRAGLEACSCNYYYLIKEQMARTFAELDHSPPDRYMSLRNG